MDHRVESSKHKLLSELDKINQVGSLTPDALKNMTCIIDGLHHIEEISMLEDVAEDYDGNYGRNRRDRYNGRGYGRGYRNDGYGSDDMRMFMEEQMRRATTEPERERIRRLMNEM